MDVQIVVFPETKVAAIEHFGSPALEHDAVGKLITWKLELRGNFPIFFHYVNVGPRVREEEMMTDVYLPLAQVSMT